jgi:hypothetical protein
MTASGDKLVFTYENIGGLVSVTFVILVLGLMGGYEIGKYAEAEFGKRRTEKTKT